MSNGTSVCVFTSAFFKFACSENKKEDHGYILSTLWKWACFTEQLCWELERHLSADTAGWEKPNSLVLDI